MPSPHPQEQPTFQPAAPEQRIAPASVESPVPHPETQQTATPEQGAPPQPEQQEVREQLPQQVESTTEDDSSMMQRLFRAGRSQKQKQRQIPQVRDAMTHQIEGIMEDGLKEAFQELTPVERQEFKIKGEQTALEIRSLLKATKVKVKKIFKLLYEWLQLLPGVNTFFLQQEAKIKTDKILAMKELHEHQRR